MLQEKENKTILSSIRDYIMSCPLLHDGAVNIGYLSNRIEYSIDVLPMTPVVKKYIDGGCQKQFGFALTSKEVFDGDARTALDSSGFYEDFERWIEDNERLQIYPELPDGLIPQMIEVTTGGYIFDIETGMAKYQIQCRLIYEWEAM